ncbi:non-specific lipid transfer protein GPI-anchored 15-like [Rhodamnia argentea]|uniref:Non-specific lipid transfer protein GPI-anchored 15-like n=1 Tax=Rhodamnia argentea TaxID=178133 RepID=A0A8B8QFW4_9MYRT|nr:non-specific lipid transfer protein GPI-anchored 15-like [Rhodamnia argentea]
MASRGIITGLVLVLAATLWTQSTAQSGCTTALTSLAPCLNFILGNSSTPSSSCCSQLASVVKATPQCLCSVMNGPSPVFGITINQTQALALPNACNVQTPPVSQCNAAANAPTPASVGAPEVPPVASPSDSPAEPSNETPTAAAPTAAAPAASTPPSGTPGTGGSKAVPSTNGNTSDGSIVKAQLRLAALVVLVASIFNRF